MYYAVFHYRKINATLVTCIVIAGIPLLLSAFPIPIPFFPLPVIVIGLATYHCARYTEIPLFPDALIIAGCVEIVTHLINRFIIQPLI